MDGWLTCSTRIIYSHVKLKYTEEILKAAHSSGSYKVLSDHSSSSNSDLKVKNRRVTAACLSVVM